METIKSSVRRTAFSYLSSHAGEGALKPEGLPLDGAAAHQARFLAGKILARVDRAPIVPDHEIAEPPLVLVDDRRILGNVEQLLERGFALLGRKALDARRHQPAHIERFLPGCRMLDDDGLL